MTFEPTRIDIERHRAVSVTWADGHVTTLELALLRRACPCAHCRQARLAGKGAGPDDVVGVHLTGAELVGAWGLGLAWSDGHATGVYEWGRLRSWCRCHDCASKGASHPDQP